MPQQPDDLDARFADVQSTIPGLSIMEHPAPAGAHRLEPRIPFRTTTFGLIVQLVSLVLAGYVIALLSIMAVFIGCSILFG
ncbi:hypothetical protein [Phytomonospora endophytica]|uniref:Uncharacterized protein n=1 Tax=Phytomonospora endophytica TaxID=714109 RepID=A0A841FU71_9ACTN|nr:hypothetical protein [Phytomonospora endophytica]MBB6039334.1 hypothetical protein [Phytomonospora endophytica]GIG69724.1 hypothetical protein Pen01_60190 [Phytomonospora endophytica]